MNGAPLTSWVEASDFTEAGRAWLALMPWSSPAVRLEMSTAPTRAVPSDAPRLVTVFCNPPTSALRRSSTAETVTAPSCEARAPMPNPISSMGMATISAPESGAMPVIRMSVPAVIDSRPNRTTRRGAAPGNSRGTPMAEISSATDRGTRRTPVWRADISRTTDKYSGMVKNTPAWMRNWKKNMDRPPTSWPLRSMGGLMSGSRRRFSRCCSHRRKQYMTSIPPNTIHTTGEAWRNWGWPGLGRIHPQSPDRRTPKTIDESPTIDRTAPRMSNRPAGSGGVSWTRRRATRMTPTITTSATKTQRHEAKVVTAPPISGPAATAMALAAAIIP